MGQQLQVGSAEPFQELPESARIGRHSGEDMASASAIRGTALTFVADPFEVGGLASARIESDALVVMQDGRITAFGAWETTKDAVPAGTPVATYANALILPGFID